MVPEIILGEKYSEKVNFVNWLFATFFSPGLVLRFLLMHYLLLQSALFLKLVVIYRLMYIALEYYFGNFWQEWNLLSKTGSVFFKVSCQSSILIFFFYRKVEIFLPTCFRQLILPFPEDLPEEVKQLLHACLTRNSDKRLSFKEVIDIFSNLKVLLIF